MMAAIVAKQLVEHLERCGFVVMKKPPIDAPPRLAAGMTGDDQEAARITVGLTGRRLYYILQIASFTEARVRRLCQSAADTGSGNGRKAQNDSEHCDSDSSHVISPYSGRLFPARRRRRSDQSFAPAKA